MGSRREARLSLERAGTHAKPARPGATRLNAWTLEGENFPCFGACDPLGRVPSLTPVGLVGRSERWSFGIDPSARPLFRRPTPDLGVSAVSAFAIAQPGGELDVEVTVANHGDGSAGASQTRLYLSLDESLSPDEDPVIATLPTCALVSGAQTVLAAPTVSIPELPPGRYYLRAEADSSATVIEYGDDNNVSERTLWLLGRRRFP